MTPRWRKASLIAHVVSSVGWIGAVLAFLGLALAGLWSPDATTVRSAYVAMDLLGWYVLVPFSLAALVTGIVQSIGTEWGLFQHYWIVLKLVLTTGSTALLPLHLQLASRLSRAAAQRTLGVDDLAGLRSQIAVDAAMTVPLLLLLTALSVYKPWGKIVFARNTAKPRSSWGAYALFGLAAIIVTIVVVHLAGLG